MKKNQNSLSKAFSLVEMLVSMAILSVLLLLLTSLLDQVQKTWRFSENRIGQFREARVAFDIITKNLSQASLNPYWDYRKDNDNVLDSYEKRSELNFQVMEASQLNGVTAGEPVGHALFFQAPLGYSNRYRNLTNLYNGRGYYVEFGDDEKYRPSFVTSSKSRFRLMEFRPPAEANGVFVDAVEERERGTDVVFDKWWQQSAQLDGSPGPFEDHVHPLAENIVLLLVSPRETIEATGDDRGDVATDIAPNYFYDSNPPPGLESDDPKAIFSHQVPPLVKITMVAIDESTAVRLEADNGSSMPTLPTDAFQIVKDYKDDVDRMSEEFSELNVSYKVFSTTVMLRSAKWSTYTVE